MTWESTILRTLQQYQQQGLYCDANLESSEGECVPVHACVLGASSRHLHWELTQGDQFMPGTVVRMPLALSDIRDFVAYIYSCDPHRTETAKSAALLGILNTLGVEESVSTNSLDHDKEKTADNCPSRASCPKINQDCGTTNNETVTILQNEKSVVQRSHHEAVAIATQDISPQKEVLVGDEREDAETETDSSRDAALTAPVSRVTKAEMQTKALIESSGTEQVGLKSGTISESSPTVKTVNEKCVPSTNAVATRRSTRKRVKKIYHGENDNPVQKVSVANSGDTVATSTSYDATGKPEEGIKSVHPKRRQQERSKKTKEKDDDEEDKVISAEAKPASPGKDTNAEIVHTIQVKIEHFEEMSASDMSSCQTCPTAKTADNKVATKRRTKRKQGISRVVKARSNVCSFCGREFGNHWHRLRHERIHTGEKPYKCQYCEKRFTRTTHLKRHENFHTKQDVFQCRFCGATFQHEGRWNYHESVHKSSGKFQCTLCDKSFPFKRSLESHLRTHSGDKPFQCIQCGKSFSTRSVLNEHERAHRGEKRFACSFCPARFVRHSEQTVHERVHTGARPHKCRLCDKHFRTQSARIEHERIHPEFLEPAPDGQPGKSKAGFELLTKKPKVSKPRIHACTICGKKWEKNCYRLRHEKTHLGERLHKCSICGKGFSNLGHQKRHEKSHDRNLLEEIGGLPIILCKDEAQKYITCIKQEVSQTGEHFIHIEETDVNMFAGPEQHISDEKVQPLFSLQDTT